MSISLFFRIGHIHICWGKVIDEGYGLPTSANCCVWGCSHTSEWMTLTKTLCCFPSWHASHTWSTFFESNFSKLLTTPIDCIAQSFYWLRWPVLWCHKSMLDSILSPLAYMADFTSLVLRMNVRPSLYPRAISWPLSSMKQPSWLNWTCIPCSMICLTKTRFFVIVKTCKPFLMYPFYQNGWKACLWCVGLGVSSHLQSRHSRALSYSGTIFHGLSFGWRLSSQRITRLPTSRC